MQWRRQLWSTGARAASNSNCLIFLVTPEPHKLWHWTVCGCLPRKNIQADSFVTVYCPNFIKFVCVSPLNYFLVFSPRNKSWRLLGASTADVQLNFYPLAVLFYVIFVCHIFFIKYWILNDGERLFQRASCAVTAVGLQRTKSKMFNDNPYVENTPSPTSVDIKGILLFLSPATPCA